MIFLILFFFKLGIKFKTSHYTISAGDLAPEEPPCQPVGHFTLGTALPDTLPSPFLCQTSPKPYHDSPTAAQTARGDLGDCFCLCTLAVKKEGGGGKGSRNGMCSLQPNPDATLALQLALRGPKAHAATVCDSLRHREFTEMHLSVERFGLDLAGLRRLVT